ncbi:MAG: hypothetical protein H6565_11005 [Lewinellaceae bacterium]|nr:hypothetical protein [Lewinellaceae bacterium]
MSNKILFENLPVLPVFDEDYLEVAVQSIQFSYHRCYCSVFIVDHDLDNFQQLKVDTILFELSSAHWRGVDTRLIIGGSRDNRRIQEPALLAYSRAKDLNIETKLVANSEDNNSHVKLIIADDLIITGSHNWSRSLSSEQTQDSVLLNSAPLANYLTRYFETQWHRLTNSKHVI